jgi:predicted polyphosphate/ATP-dependent NAD kinase
VRRLVAKASVFHTAEKCNMVQRALAALGAVGVKRAVMMPDLGGIAAGVLRGLQTHAAEQSQPWPELTFLDMQIEDAAIDSVHAVEMMTELGVAAILVMGGDGTHRVVASRCGAIPLVALSTGTNNAFPEIREATIAGLAAGLVATEAVPLEKGTVRNKVLRLNVNDKARDLALVDVCVTTDRWIGARALWKPHDFSELFVTTARSDAIGLSAIAGLLHPVNRTAEYGLRLTLCPPGEGTLTLNVPIAPGLIAPVGIVEVREIFPTDVWPLQTPRGVVALDGEREIEFGPEDQITVALALDGPVTVDVAAVMQYAAQHRLFSERSPPALRSVRGTRSH